MSDVYTVKMRKVLHISVDCVRNDSVDIRCGGPPTLGFDFYVGTRVNVVDYKAFINRCLRDCNVPLMGITVRKDSIEADRKLWTKGRIREAIRKEKSLHNARAW